MPIFRWLIICLAVWLVVAILRRLIKTRQQNKTIKTAAPPYTATVACHNCNLHLPKVEAIQNNGRYYCSTECRTK